MVHRIGTSLPRHDTEKKQVKDTSEQDADTA